MAKVTLARLEELKRRALALVPQRDACVCRLIHVTEGEPLTEEEQRQVEANRECFERHNRSTSSHVGFSVVVVARQPFRPDYGEEPVDEDDDAPLVA